MIKNLGTITGDKLFDLELFEPRVIIERILPAGLHILAGSPKIGKSWLVLWICQMIATGQPVWDFKTTKGNVLYLCLEDKLPRIKSRLMSITEDGSENTAFATESLLLGDGLTEQIESYLQAYKDTALIVIDTLQQVRGQTDNQTYGSDYADISSLKKTADKYDLAIICVHHLRKMRDDDPFNMISGTTGLSGSSDSMFVLKRDNRSSGKATLYGTGRDIADIELSLEFDQVNCLWRLLENDDNEEISDEPILQSIVDYINTNISYTGTMANLITELNIRNLTAAMLSKKIRVNTEVLSSKFDIEVVFTRNRKSRVVTVNKKCDGDDGVYTP